MSELREAINDYRTTTLALRDFYVERAQVRVAEEQARTSAYRDLNDGTRNVTQVREEARLSASQFTQDAIELDGDIDAHLAHLRWLDLWIKHLRADVSLI